MDHTSIAGQKILKWKKIILKENYRRKDSKWSGFWIFWSFDEISTMLSDAAVVFQSWSYQKIQFCKTWDFQNLQNGRKSKWVIFRENLG